MLRSHLGMANLLQSSRDGRTAPLSKGRKEDRLWLGTADLLVLQNKITMHLTKKVFIDSFLPIQRCQ